MAEVTALNAQITDAVTQTDVQVVASAGAIAMGNLYQATAQALGNAAHNATMAQHLANITAQAVTVQGVNMLLGVGSAADATATAKVIQSDQSRTIADLVAVISALAVNDEASRPRG